MSRVNRIEADRLDPATDELVRRMYPSLRRFAAVAGPADCEPDDLVQDALLQTLRAHRLPELDYPEAYLRRAILNLANNDRRKNGRRLRSLVRMRGGQDDGSPDSYPSDLADLLRLPAQSRAVLYMAVIERTSHAEIASVLGISEANSRLIASRARQVLRTSAEGDTQ